MVLSFPRQIRGWDFRRNVVNFTAQDDSEPEVAIACAISMEALIEHFGARNSGKQACLAAFDRWRVAIEKKASEKHALQAAKGQVLLQKKDFS